MRQRGSQDSYTQTKTAPSSVRRSVYLPVRRYLLQGGDTNRQEVSDRMHQALEVSIN